MSHGYQCRTSKCKDNTIQHARVYFIDLYAQSYYAKKKKVSFLFKIISKIDISSQFDYWDSLSSTILIFLWKISIKLKKPSVQRERLI